ncbi:MAG: rhodanese-like domain-containing protein, partial [Bacteroidales bacterium]|nr:rhodanese-like domain-containing protein [Bacteroidales bacterium]
MSSPRILLLLSGLFTGLFASCQKYENLGAEAFCARLADDAVQLLDVRTPEEFSAGHLPGAANIDWLADGFIEGASAALDKARPVAVYCRSGKRSAASAAALTKAGFQVVNLLGGYAGWTAEGRPAVTGEQDALEAQYAATLLAPGTQAPDFT